MLSKEEARKLGRRIVARVTRLSKKLGWGTVMNSNCYESDGAYHVHIYCGRAGTRLDAPAVVEYLKENEEHLVLGRTNKFNYGTCDIPFESAELTDDELREGILEAMKETNWELGDILKTCFLPYLQRHQLKKIVDEHCAWFFTES